MQVLEIKHKNVITIIFKPLNPHFFSEFDKLMASKYCNFVTLLGRCWVGGVVFDSFLVKRNVGAISPSILSFVSVI